MPATRNSSTTMEEQLRSMEQRLEEQSQKQEAQSRLFEESMARMLQAITELKNDRGDRRPSESPRSETGERSSARILGYVPKLEFPKFDGTNARLWIKKCSKYFSLCKIADDQKVDLASLHMIEKAECWVTSYLAVRKGVDWSDFVIDVNARFKDDYSRNVVEKFNKLQQDGSLEQYIDDFETLKSLMMQDNHDLPEAYMLDSFIGGMKPAVKPLVKAFKPTSITQAIEYARLLEESLSLNTTKYPKHTSNFAYSKPIQATPLSSHPPLLPNPLPPSTSSLPLTKFNPRQRNSRHIPADVKADKIARGLCYYCDKPFEKGHKCDFKEPQLFTVEIPGSSSDNDEDSPLPESPQGTEPCISVHALLGNQSYNTMRLTGVQEGRTLHILVDSGSTHNFLDLSTAKKLGCKLEFIPSQAVTVADGNNLQCQYIVKDFEWEMNGKLFTTDVMLIDLGSCDMVLGIQWLSTLGTVFWDFKNLIMEFTYDGVQFVLKGLTPKKLAVTNAISNKSLEHAAQLCLIQVRQVCLAGETQLLHLETMSSQTPAPELLALPTWGIC